MYQKQLYTTYTRIDLQQLVNMLITRKRTYKPSELAHYLNQLLTDLCCELAEDEKHYRRNERLPEK